MSKPNRPSAILDAYLQDREDEWLDAVVTCAALVARADGWVDPAERRVRDLLEPDGAAAALARLRRYAGQAFARLMVAVGEEVASADCRIDPREQRVLQLIRASLGESPAPGEPNRLARKDDQ
jgi:tellurite resistance protein